MMARHLLLISLQLVVMLKISRGTVCREDDIIRDLRRIKPDYFKRPRLWEKPSSPRTLIRSLENCTIYLGDIKISDDAAKKDKFEEDIRYQDFRYLRNLQEIHGCVSLNLEEYPAITNFSFFENLKEIQTPSRRGFTLMHSKIEMFNFSNFRLWVPYAAVAWNDRLCYMERFGTLNATTHSTVLRNRDPVACAREGKVCSRSCDPTKGCWGPEDRHCFECGQWRAVDACVDSCESRSGFFTPSKGLVCGRCHESCPGGCYGPSETHCYSQPQLDCPKYAFANASEECEECSGDCFGLGYDNRHQLTTRACTGPGNWTGPGGCSSGCRGMTFLTVTPHGLLECSHCHEDCLVGCQNESLSGCFQVKPPEIRTTTAAMEKKQCTTRLAVETNRGATRATKSGETRATDNGETRAMKSGATRATKSGETRAMKNGETRVTINDGGPNSTLPGLSIATFVLACVLALLTVCLLYKKIRKHRKSREVTREAQYRARVSCVNAPSAGEAPNEESGRVERPPSMRGRRELYEELDALDYRPMGPRRHPLYHEMDLLERLPYREMNRSSRMALWELLSLRDFLRVPPRRTAAPGDVVLALPLRNPRHRPFPMRGHRTTANRDDVGGSRDRPPLQDRDGDDEASGASLLEEPDEETWTGRRGWSQVANHRNPIVVCSARRKTILRLKSQFWNDSPPLEEDPSFTEV